MTLTYSDKQYLLNLAWHSIRTCLGVPHADEPPVPTPPEGERLSKQHGVFVTIRIGDELRGCIGTFSEEEPLYRNVCNMAISAATSDSRFDPIECNDIEKMKLEISVLSPRKKVSCKEEIILGTHGIYIIKGDRKGTLLPQVAVQQKWSVEEFLGNCARYKAGIGWDGWKTAEIYCYETIVFDSEQFPPDC